MHNRKTMNERLRRNPQLVKRLRKQQRRQDKRRAVNTTNDSSRVESQ